MDDPPIEVSNDDANALADQILLRDEFLAAREPGFFSRSVNWVLEQIGRFLEWLFGGLFGGAGGTGAGSVVAYLLLGLAIILLGYVLIKAFFHRPGDTADDDQRGPRIVFDEIVDPVELRAQLDRARSAGDHRSAVIAGFRLAILALIDAGISVDAPGATTGDFGRAVQRNRTDLAPIYWDASGSFERAFYSELEIGVGDVSNIDRLLGSLQGVGAP
ncbi:MAG: hypothetical protein ACR2P0_19110 [Acidimicrobiales bacterium]